MVREIKRWGDRLPLGSAGFHVYATANQIINAGATALVNFDSTATIGSYKLDRERWKPPGTVNTLIVPPGLSGVYVMNYAGYHAAAASVFTTINVNGVGAGQPLIVGLAEDRSACFATYILRERDVLSVSFFNNSGGNLTQTVVAGNTVNPYMPFFSAWRISLL